MADNKDYVCVNCDKQHANLHHKTPGAANALDFDSSYGSFYDMRADMKTAAEADSLIIPPKGAQAVIRIRLQDADIVCNEKGSPLCARIYPDENYEIFYASGKGDSKTGEPVRHHEIIHGQALLDSVEAGIEKYSGMSMLYGANGTSRAFSFPGHDHKASPIDDAMYEARHGHLDDEMKYTIEESDSIQRALGTGLHDAISDEDAAGMVQSVQDKPAEQTDTVHHDVDFELDGKDVHILSEDEKSNLISSLVHRHMDCTTGITFGAALTVNVNGKYGVGGKETGILYVPENALLDEGNGKVGVKLPEFRRERPARYPLQFGGPASMYAYGIPKLMKIIDPSYIPSRNKPETVILKNVTVTEPGDMRRHQLYDHDEDKGTWELFMNCDDDHMVYATVKDSQVIDRHGRTGSGLHKVDIAFNADDKVAVFPRDNSTPGKWCRAEDVVRMRNESMNVWADKRRALDISGIQAEEGSKECGLGT